MHTRSARSKYTVAPSALALLESARQRLTGSKSEMSVADRYVGAHLAASRAAAAVVAARGGGVASGDSGSRSVWELLLQVEPRLSEWAAFFAASAGRRAAAEAGLPHAVSLQQANYLLREAEAFVSIAECALAVHGKQLLSHCQPSVRSENLQQWHESSL